jgi:hypothetical protein
MKASLARFLSVDNMKACMLLYHFTFSLLSPPLKNGHCVILLFSAISFDVVGGVTMKRCLLFLVAIDSQVFISPKISLFF